jgi:hypothetical protein
LDRQERPGTQETLAHVFAVALEKTEHSYKIDQRIHRLENNKVCMLTDPID